LHLEFPWHLEHTPDISNGSWLLITVLGALFALILVIKVVIPGMIKPHLVSRQEAIAHNAEQVETTLREVAEMRDEFRQRLASIEDETRRRMDEAVHEADSLRESILAEARQQAAGILRRGEEDVARERAKSLVTLRIQFVDDVIGAAEFAAARSLTPPRQQQLVGDFVQKITMSDGATGAMP
jgi:F-type H+-transporting ATPase subunit b